MHLQAPRLKRAFYTLEGSPREAPSCGDTVSTAKTTLLPANHSLGTKKGLHSNERLDDNQDPEQKFNCQQRALKSIELGTVRKR